MDWLAEIDRIVRVAERRSQISGAELYALMPTNIEPTCSQIEDLLTALQEHGVTVVGDDDA